MNKWVKASLILFVLCLLFIPAMFLFKTVAIHQIYSHYVDSVSNLTGLNRYLVKTAVILMLIPFLMGIRWYFFSIGNKRRKYIGAALVVTIIVIYNLGLYGVTKSSYFDFSEGKVSKWYASTPEGIRFFDSPGYDPKYGVKLKPVTPQIIAGLEKKKRGMQPNRVVFDSLDQIELFDRITGENKLWYYKDSSGDYEFFDGPGIHPTYGESLEPVTRQMLFQIKGSVKEKTERKQKKAERSRTKKAAKQREAYINRYLVTRSFLNQPNSTELASLVIGETGKAAQDIDQDIASRLRKKGLNATASLFTGPFVSDGIFDRIFNGNPGVVRKLRLSKHCDQIVLGKSSASFTRNPDLENMITARVSIQFRIISARTGAVENRFTLSETGVGFSKAAAEDLAIERIVNRLETQIFDAKA